MATTDHQVSGPVFCLVSKKLTINAFGFCLYVAITCFSCVNQSCELLRAMLPCVSLLVFKSGSYQANAEIRSTKFQHHHVKLNVDGDRSMSVSLVQLGQLHRRTKQGRSSNVNAFFFQLHYPGAAPDRREFAGLRVSFK